MGRFSEGRRFYPTCVEAIESNRAEETKKKQVDKHDRM
jgi:hypothetical protein